MKDGCCVQCEAIGEERGSCLCGYEVAWCHDCGRHRAECDCDTPAYDWRYDDQCRGCGATNGCDCGHRDDERGDECGCDSPFDCDCVVRLPEAKPGVESLADWASRVDAGEGDDLPF